MCFNTASGMRSHVTLKIFVKMQGNEVFQYRKRYEITCDFRSSAPSHGGPLWFQYRKRYEITCDVINGYPCGISREVSIPQAV